MKKHKDGPEVKKAVDVLPLDEARARLLAAIAAVFDGEERVVAFLLELQPLEGSWEIVEMARNCGGRYHDFWTVGVAEWLARDVDNERLAELSRVYTVLTAADAEEEGSSAP